MAANICEERCVNVSYYSLTSMDPTFIKIQQLLIRILFVMSDVVRRCELNDNIMINDKRDEMNAQ